MMAFKDRARFTGSDLDYTIDVGIERAAGGGVSVGNETVAAGGAVTVVTHNVGALGELVADPAGKTMQFTRWHGNAEYSVSAVDVVNNGRHLRIQCTRS